MGRLRRAAGLVLLVGFSALSARAVEACVDDADCDNRDTCSVADTCVAGSCVAGGGGDTDVPPGTRDFVCDGELDGNLSLAVNKLVVRKRTSGVGDNSSARGKGSLVALPSSPLGAFTTLDGITVRVIDTLSLIDPPVGDGIDASHTWSGAECTENGGVASCKSPDGRSFVRFRQNPVATTQWSFFFKIKGLGNLAGPFFGPLRVVLTHHGNQHRSVLITDCKLTVPGLKCREF